MKSYIAIICAGENFIQNLVLAHPTNIYASYS